VGFSSAQHDVLIFAKMPIFGFSAEYCVKTACIGCYMLTSIIREKYLIGGCMKKRQIFGFLVIFGLFCSMLFSCGISTEELAKQVQDSVIETYRARDIIIQWEPVKELKLVKKSKTEYTGLMQIGSGIFGKSLSINVIFDGNSFQWEAEER